MLLHLANRRNQIRLSSVPLEVSFGRRRCRAKVGNAVQELGDNLISVQQRW